MKSGSAMARRPVTSIVLCVEFLVSLGTAVLTIVAMPFFGIVTNVTMLNSISILSSIFQVGAQCIARERKRFIVPPLISLVLILSGYVLFILSYLLKEDRGMNVWIGLAIMGTIFVSLNWWENYSTLFKSSFLNSISEDIARCRNVVSILSSLVRIMVTAAVVGAYIPLSGRVWSSVTSVPGDVKLVILILVAVQIVSSALCHWFVVVACKMHAMRRSFLLPMYLASLGVLAAFVAPVIIFFQNSSDSRGANYTITEYCNDITYGRGLSGDTFWFERLVRDITHTLCPQHMTDLTEMGLLGGSALCWWLGWMLCTMHIWFLQLQRIERTQNLFVRRMYEGPFLEQSMLLNTQKVSNYVSSSHRQTDPITVYLCATMWHESYDEMMKMIISMFRLDKYRPRKDTNNDVSFESHIYFDDAFKDVKGSKGRHVNEYAEDLVEVIREVYNPPLPCQSILHTPYGGRLEYILPNGNLLMVHFKDKLLIRHKKRWSQIMYLYYILGWRLTRKYFKKFEQGGDESELREKMMVNRNGTDTLPYAVMLLIDRLKLYPRVGAACGRIHPTGTGPMVWYQKFEYAVGHWLQKTAEHVFGSVLCSPGCFSLFRGTALMDDNVMKRYTTKATEASHYVQYDQGEDRWLCTLLLQQGWRVEYNAASDAYTNAPQDFKEFYNQRRRWGPSTMANTIDLLGSGSLTSQRNSSISKPFILYQILSMAASILGPATICLMISGIHGNLPVRVPPVVYLLLCFKLKSDTQIAIAAVMSVLYAFLMIGTALSIIGAMVEQQTIWTPSGLFIIGLVLMNIITAALHPKEFHLVIYGLLYFISIPSGYLLLTIYSMVNMNNVSWGTRETGVHVAAPPPAKAITQRILQAKCCKFLCWDSGKVADQNGQLPETVVLANEPKVNPNLTSQDNNSRRCSTLSVSGIIKDCFNSTKLSLVGEIHCLCMLACLVHIPLIETHLPFIQVTFIFFICNAMWLVATFTLQAIGTSVTIKIPKSNLNLTQTREYLFIDPVGLMFLLGFASLLLIQFFAMFYHRIYTLIHFVAFANTESKTEKRQSDDGMQVN
uniref:chitin synthase n=1 Tax=Oncorhynchus mykiss TaxID=8022 RepID=A0A8C7VUL9_ONCMY